MPVAVQVSRSGLREYLRGLADGDLDACRAVALGQLHAGCGVEAVAVQLVGVAQQHVGSAWAAGRWSAAAERRATAVGERVLDTLVEAGRGGRTTTARGRLLLLPAQTEVHRLGLRIAAVVLRERGWRVELLDPAGADVAGPGVPDDLPGGDDVVAVGVGAVTTASLAGAWQTVRALRGAGVRVLAGGRALEHDQRGVRLGADAAPGDLGASDLVLRRWAAAGPVPPRDDVVDPERAEIAERLCAQRARRVDAALVRVLAQAPGLVDTAVARGVAVDDLGLALDAATGALLLDDPRVLRDHLAWSAQVLEGHGSARTVALLWLQALRDSLPTWAADVRGLLDAVLPQVVPIAEQVARTRLPALADRLTPVS